MAQDAGSSGRECLVEHIITPSISCIRAGSGRAARQGHIPIHRTRHTWWGPAISQEWLMWRLCLEPMDLVGCWKDTLATWYSKERLSDLGPFWLLGKRCMSLKRIANVQFPPTYTKSKLRTTHQSLLRRLSSPSI